MPKITLLLHNIRSTHNVGSLFRSAEGFGVERIIISGYTPYPSLDHDKRLPHIREKITRDIHKTALGAESMLPFEYSEDVMASIAQLRQKGYRIIGLEQDARSISLPNYHPSSQVVLILGEEVAGVDPEIRDACDDILEIPMYGHKESFNVSVAGGIALYHLITSS